MRVRQVARVLGWQSSNVRLAEGPWRGLRGASQLLDVESIDRTPGALSGGLLGPLRRRGGGLSVSAGRAIEPEQRGGGGPLVGVREG
jgi:hypothetical protein